MIYMALYPDSKFVLKYGEQDLLKKYRTLDSHGKKIVDFVLTEEADRCSCESTCTLSVEEQCAAVARDIRKYIGQIDVHDPGCRSEVGSSYSRRSSGE